MQGILGKYNQNNWATTTLPLSLLTLSPLLQHGTIAKDNRAILKPVISDARTEQEVFLSALLVAVVPPQVRM